MKILILILTIFLSLLGCSSSKNKNTTNSSVKKEDIAKTQDTIKIEDEDSEFRVIIFDPKFSGWLAAYAKPRGYYSESFLKEHNRLCVMEWNSRVNQPQKYGSDLYNFAIDYDFREDYGYEVNYLLYNYFVFFQLTYNQRLSTFIPRP